MECEYTAVRPNRLQAEETEKLLKSIGIQRSSQDIMNSRCMVAVDEKGEIDAMGEMLGQDQGEFWHFRKELSRKKKTRAITCIRSKIFGCNRWKDICLSSSRSHEKNKEEGEYMFY